MNQFYQNHITQLKTQQNLLDNKYKRTSTLRLSLLIFGLIVIVNAFQFHFLLGSTLIILFLLGFYYLVKFHETIENELALNVNEQLVSKNELSVLKNHLSNEYENGKEYSNSQHPFSDDLDLFGEGSVFQLINRAKTRKGNDLLSYHMLTIDQKEEQLIERQNAVKELVQNTEWRLKFQASLFGVKYSETAFSEQMNTLQMPPKLIFGSFLKWYGKLLPLIWLLIVGIGAYWFLENLGYIIFGVFLFNFYLGALNKKTTEAYLESVAVSGRALNSYAQAAELIANQEFKAKVFKDALLFFPSSSLKSKNPIKEFASIVKKLETRKNMLAAIFLTIFKPFEPIETINLGEWIIKNPDFFKRIFNTIAQFEYFGSLATLHFNQPNWTFPVYHKDENRLLNFTQVGHPLIRGHKTVCNDFELNANNLLNLITGSNMSGKSTFLRTLGINLILGNLGSPVFATKMECFMGLSPVCYMRITDSLNQNASTFKAEIERIKLVLLALDSKKKHLFLIDEMLRGTNSEDKMVGSIALLEKLVNCKAPTLVATHDLRLTDISKKYPSKVKNFYFEYSSENGDLNFDYLIKEGICTSFNASLLLASIGLDMNTENQKST